MSRCSPTSTRRGSSTSSTRRRWPPARSASPPPRTRCARGRPRRAVQPLAADRLQPEVLRGRRGRPGRHRAGVRAGAGRRCVHPVPHGRVDHRLGARRRRPQRRDRRALLGRRGQRRVPDGARAPPTGAARGRPERHRLGPHGRTGALRRRPDRADRRVGRVHARRAHPARPARPRRARDRHRRHRAGVRALRRVGRPEPAPRHRRAGRVPRRPVARVPRPRARGPPRRVDLAAVRRPVGAAAGAVLGRHGRCPARRHPVHVRAVDGGRQRRPARRLPGVAARLRHVPDGDGRRGPPAHRRASSWPGSAPPTRCRRVSDPAGRCADDVAVQRGQGPRPRRPGECLLRARARRLRRRRRADRASRRTSRRPRRPGRVARRVVLGRLSQRDARRRRRAGRCRCSPSWPRRPTSSSPHRRRRRRSPASSRRRSG